MVKPKYNLKILILTVLLGLPQLVFANSLIVSTIKNPDPYNGNLSWFRFYEYPGTTVKDSLILRNIGTETETVKLYAADATSNQAGSFTPKMSDEEQKGIGAWAKLSAKELTLAPDETKEVSFEINIPKSITPGQYFGSIIYEQVSNSTCDSTQAVSGICEGNIQIKTRTGNRIYLTIPGETKQDIKLTDLKWKTTDLNSIHFTFNFINSGNVAFEPKAIIHLYNRWGQKITTLESNLGKSLPGTSISPSMEWKYGQNFGEFTVKTEIYYLEDNQGRFDNLRGTVLSDKKEITLFIFPWTVTIISLIVIALAAGAYFSRRFYFRKILNCCLDYTVQKDENLVELASKFHTGWRTIAYINKIKPPYVIQENQIIKIPQNKKRPDEK
jgi:hypothetical protein